MAALRAGNGIHPQVRGAHYPVLERGRGLQRPQFLPPGFLQATAELGQALGQHQVVLGAVPLHLGAATGIPDRQVGAQLATALFLGTVQFRLEKLQGQ